VAVIDCPARSGGCVLLTFDAQSRRSLMLEDMEAIVGTDEGIDRAETIDLRRRINCCCGGWKRLRRVELGRKNFILG
jgi:hypothetical protein